MTDDRRGKRIVGKFTRDAIIAVSAFPNLKVLWYCEKSPRVFLSMLRLRDQLSLPLRRTKAVTGKFESIYLRHRAVLSRKASSEATDVCARLAHKRLAEMYDDKAGATAPASHSPPDNV